MYFSSIFLICLFITNMECTRQEVWPHVTIQFIEINHAQSYNHSTDSQKTSRRIHCSISFNKIWSFLYSVFLVTFSMLDFTYTEASNEQLALIYFYHFAYTLFIGVMLLNFFIALYTFYITEFMEFRDAIIAIEKIMMLHVSEYRLQRVLKRWVYRQENNYFPTDDNEKPLRNKNSFAKKKSTMKSYITRITTV